MKYLLLLALHMEMVEESACIASLPCSKAIRVIWLLSPNSSRLIEGAADNGLCWRAARNKELLALCTTTHCCLTRSITPNAAPTSPGWFVSSLSSNTPVISTSSSTKSPDRWDNLLLTTALKPQLHRMGSSSGGWWAGENTPGA